MKTCEYCGKEIVPAASYSGRPSRYEKVRFCSRQCSTKSRSNRTPIDCPVCGETFLAKPSETTRKFCSNACYLKDHASPPQTCETCGKQFVAYRIQKYCCTACQPRIGEDNPNFGKRHPGMFEHTAEARKALSVGRLGKNNPRWDGGRHHSTGKYRMQTWVSNWAKEVLGDCCAECGEDGATLHHIIPRIRFSHVIMSHFRQNLVMLCSFHHAKADKAFRLALKQDKLHDLPHSDRLPESILDQLRRDGSVSRLTRECDYSPLGTAAESMIREEWFENTI